MSGQPEGDDLFVSITARPLPGDEIVVREVALGVVPLVLVEFKLHGDGVHLVVDATGASTVPEVIEMLANVVEALTDAHARGPVEPPGGRRDE